MEPIKSSVVLEDYSILMNISWILRADGKFASKIRPDVSAKAEKGRLYNPLLPLPGTHPTEYVHARTKATD